MNVNLSECLIPQPLKDSFFDYNAILEDQAAYHISNTMFFKGFIPWNKGLKGCHSEETRKKIGLRFKGIHLSEDHRRKIGNANAGERHWLYGKHHSEVSRKKMSLAKIGRPVSEEVRRKLKGRPAWNKGKNTPDEVRAKLSQAHLGIHHSEESKKKISEHSKGRPAWNKGLHIYSRGCFRKGRIPWNKEIRKDLCESHMNLDGRMVRRSSHGTFATRDII